MMLQMPFAMIPMVLVVFVQFNVSINRINHFLNLEEVDPLLVEHDIPAGTKPTYKDINGNEKTVDDYDAEKDAVLIRDGTFAWGENDPCLTDISFKQASQSPQAKVPSRISTASFSAS